MTWLSPPHYSLGARAVLADRLRARRLIPFTPISAFGFALDEEGPNTMAAPIGRTGAAAPVGTGNRNSET